MTATTTTTTTTAQEESQPVAFLTPRQQSSLRAVVRALLPPLPATPSVSSHNDDDAATTAIMDKFWSHDLSSNQSFLTALVHTIQFKLNETERSQLQLLLTALSNTIATQALFLPCMTGFHEYYYTMPFSEWPSSEAQTMALQSWQHSRLLVLHRQAFSSLKRLVCGLAFSFVDQSSLGRLWNPFWTAMDYPGPPVAPPRLGSTSATSSSNAAAAAAAAAPTDFNIHRAFVPVFAPPMQDKDHETKNATTRKTPTTTTTTKTVTLDYDVIIVGSGAGGGVAAAILAQSFSVVVLEKGPYVPPSEVSSLEVEALDGMYEKHGLLTTKDGNVMLLAGSTLGGGTAINWACCLPLPDSVRQEWSSGKQHGHGLTQFDSDEYKDSLRAVQERIGCTVVPSKDDGTSSDVDDDHRKKANVVCHNAMNQKMKQGCQIMGYDCQTTGQNLRDTAADSAGYTCFGDAQRNKQSGLVTYLADAVANGANLIDGVTVEKVMWETSGDTGRKRAVGVVATVEPTAHNGGRCHEQQQQQQQQERVLLRVNARKCVIVAAGSLHSPCLLQRSGFRNPHIGRHLHLHPVTAAFGFYKETIHPYLGAPMTTVCNDFDNAKLECPSVHTGLAAASFPYLNAFDFKSKMLRLKNSVALIVLQRDVESEGRVRVGSDGFSPSIDYKLRDGDKQNMMDALKGAVKILIASGAREVGTGHIDDAGIVIENDAESAKDIERNDEIKDYLASISERGMKDHEIGVFSAHQMSTCRMSSTPDSGVVDENGETWECDNLFVFDASVFPTASGANPMLTTLTVSHMLSTRLAAERLAFKEDASSSTKADIAPRVSENAAKRAKQPRYYRLDRVARLPWTVVVAIAIASGVGFVKRYLRED